MAQQTFHIGNRIKEKLKEEGHSVAWLVKQLSCERSSGYKILKQPHIHPERIKEISRIVKYDFFIDYSADLKK
jgi:hypothetical protein